MKSFFLLLLILGTLSNLAMAESSATKKKSKAVIVYPTTAPSNPIGVPPADESKKNSTYKFYERLKIGYYGGYTSPHFHDMRSEWRNAAISPSFQKDKEGKNQDTLINVFNQISFNN